MGRGGALGKEKKNFSQIGKKILTLDLMLECIGILLCSLWGCFVRGHRTRLKITTGRRLARIEKIEVTWLRFYLALRQRPS